VFILKDTDRFRYLTPQLPNTAHSCNQHRLVILGWWQTASQHYTLPETFTLIGVQCLLQCVVGSQYETTRTVNKARKTVQPIPLHSIV